ncbi:hypothetical protein DYB35_005566 [Aphanomyces astaci]|uniref:Exocyst subunit Exo70 family protein n=1 Tax=Aphanomyces astaci TaxID=112090 RepID=A0A418DA62_APHAT|nr:hypothetical protein DYB35_005566 [Aphanomyces astaci]
MFTSLSWSECLGDIVSGSIGRHELRLSSTRSMAEAASTTLTAFATPEHTRLGCGTENSVRGSGSRRPRPLELLTQLSTVNSVLTGFKCGLDRLEGQMMPIYNLTEKLRETQKNIDLSVHELRAVNETFATATEVRHRRPCRRHKSVQVAPTLHQGAKYDQAEYFKAMHRLLESISFMESHRGYEGCGKALEQARHVLNQAQVKCKSDIVNDIGLFCRYAMTSPVSSDTDDNDPSIDQGKAQQEPVVTASQPSDADVAKVNALVQCLLDTGLVPRQLLVEYGEKRLKHIKDFFKDANAATPPADISTAQHMKESIGRYLDMVVYVIRPPLRLREHPGVETADPWKLVGIVAKMEEELAVAAKSTLSHFKSDIGDALMQDKQPGRFRDGNVHPVSSNVMQFVRHLCDHVVELECLLKSDQTTNVAYFVDSIVMKLIESLKASNVIKGGREDLRTLFTLNNVVYISQSLKQLGQDLHTPAQAVVTAALQQTIQPKVAALGDKAIQDFMHLRYSVVHFSKKHMDKYVKYTPANVDAMLHELFQGLHHPSTSSHASSS